MFPQKGSYCSECNIWLSEMNPEREVKDGVAYHSRCLRAKEKKAKVTQEEVDRFWENLHKLFPAEVH